MNRKNLKKLADYVHENGEQFTFNMGSFYEIFSNQYEPSSCLEPYEKQAQTVECGSTACFLGHGPAAGIRALPKETWLAYGERNFVPWLSEEWAFLFSSDWDNRDNTPEGAVLRAYYLLKTGNILHPRHSSVELYRSMKEELLDWAYDVKHVNKLELEPA